MFLGSCMSLVVGKLKVCPEGERFEFTPSLWHASTTRAEVKKPALLVANRKFTSILLLAIQLDPILLLIWLLFVLSLCFLIFSSSVLWKKSTFQCGSCKCQLTGQQKGSRVDQQCLFRSSVLRVCACVCWDIFLCTFFAPKWQNSESVREKLKPFMCSVFLKCK